MEEILQLLVGLVNVAIAGINLAVAIMNAHNRKNPNPGESDKGSNNK